MVKHSYCVEVDDNYAEGDFNLQILAPGIVKHWGMNKSEGGDKGKEL